MNNWYVNIFKKMTVDFYFLMASFIFLDLIFMKNRILEHLAMICFFGGIIAMIVSIFIYFHDIQKWDEKKSL